MADPQKGSAMTVSSWDESLETGNKLIDDQHRDLIGLVDELKGVAAGPEAEILRALDKVMEFTLTHFIAEEDLMKQVGYPPFPSEVMVQQHMAFTSYARHRVLEFRKGKMVSVLPLQAYLEEFLKWHEFGLDRMLADWIRDQN
jgi:hemerythrin